MNTPSGCMTYKDFIKSISVSCGKKENMTSEHCQYRQYLSNFFQVQIEYTDIILIMSQTNLTYDQAKNALYKYGNYINAINNTR